MPSAASLSHRALALLNALRPAPQAVNARERLRVLLGAGLGILLAGALSQRADAGPAVAGRAAGRQRGAGVRRAGQPLAQPWAVVGGNTVSALVGIACLRWLPLPPLAVAVAVALAIGLMFLLRCLHRPAARPAC
jgi:CBS domain-containing membrane protein